MGSGTGSSRRTLLRLEGEEDLAPLVRAISEKGQFRSKKSFSQPLRNPFRSCELSVTVLRSGTSVPKSLSQLRNTLRNGTLVAKSGIFTLYRFAAVSQLRNGGSCAAKWHSCAKIGFAVAKILAKESNELRNGLATKF
uniref:Uncharacterized protein n=1 Tax=Vitis vinifera TaxID=29760 RepID=A5B796_VITVI|nr:hypothetical protein VITISV_027580 [Vitis vinifera]